MSDYKKVDEFLEDAKSRPAESIFKKIKKLDKLDHLFKQFIPLAAQPLVRVANIYQDQLIVFVANASLATQLRLATNTYVQKFSCHEELKFIRGIHFKVRPQGYAPETLPKDVAKNTIAPLSKKTAILVSEIAENIEDPKLKAALKRIALHQKTE